MILEIDANYPVMVNISSLLEDDEKYKDTVGTYYILPEVTHEERPVFGKKNNKQASYIFYSCK